MGHATAIAYAEAGVAAMGLDARSSLSGFEKIMKQAVERARVPKILFVQLYVQDRASVEAASQKVVKAFSSVNILVTMQATYQKISRLGILIQMNGGKF